MHNGVQFQDGDTASTGSAIRLTTLVQLHNPRFWDLRRRVNPEILNFAVQVIASCSSLDHPTRLPSLLPHSPASMFKARCTQPPISSFPFFPRMLHDNSP